MAYRQKNKKIQQALFKKILPLLISGIIFCSFCFVVTAKTYEVGFNISGVFIAPTQTLSFASAASIRNESAGINRVDSYSLPSSLPVPADVVIVYMLPTFTFEGGNSYSGHVVFNQYLSTGGSSTFPARMYFGTLSSNTVSPTIESVANLGDFTTRTSFGNYSQWNFTIENSPHTTFNAIIIRYRGVVTSSSGLSNVRIGDVKEFGLDNTDGSFTYLAKLSEDLNAFREEEESRWQVEQSNYWHEREENWANQQSTNERDQSQDNEASQQAESSSAAFDNANSQGTYDVSIDSDEISEEYPPNSDGALWHVLMAFFELMTAGFGMFFFIGATVTVFCIVIKKGSS